MKNKPVEIRVDKPSNKGGLWRVRRVVMLNGVAEKSIGKGHSYKEAAADALRKEIATYARRGVIHPTKLEPETRIDKG